MVNAQPTFSSTPHVRRFANGLAFIKLALLLVFVVVTNPGMATRVHAIGLQAGLAVYVAIWVASVAAILFVAFFGGWTARIVWSGCGQQPP